MEGDVREEGPALAALVILAALFLFRFLVLLPANILRADATVEADALDLVQRGLKMYDKKNHTYVINQAVNLDIIIEFLVIIIFTPIFLNNLISHFKILGSIWLITIFLLNNAAATR